MSVVDDLKNTFGGSNGSSNRSDGHSSNNSSGFDDGLDSDFGSDLGSSNDRQINPEGGQRPQNADNRLGNNQNSPNQGRGNSGDFNRHGNDAQSRSQGRSNPNSQRRPGNNSNQGDLQHSGAGRNDHPNAQAGRPQQGSSSPQVSSQTQRKMENAGFKSNNQGQNRGRNEPVSSQRNDLEELKSQNEQIIELLKRVNRNLEQLGR